MTLQRLLSTLFYLGQAFKITPEPSSSLQGNGQYYITAKYSIRLFDNIQNTNLYKKIFIMEEENNL